MTVYTFAAGNVASGSLQMIIENYSRDVTDENLDFLLINLETDRNIEENANVLQVTKATFKAWNTGGEFSAKALYSTSSVVDARVWVKLNSGDVFYGNIDPFSVRYSNQGRVVEFTTYSLIDELGNVTVDNVRDYIKGTLILGRTQQAYSTGATQIIYNATLGARWFIPVGEIIRFGVDATEYTVTAVDGRELTISPALSANVADDTEIYSRDLRFAIASVQYLKIADLIKTLYRLGGFYDSSTSLSRLRFYRDATNYHNDVGNLAIIYTETDGFFDSASDKSFYGLYAGKDEALGILKGLCHSFALFADHQLGNEHGTLVLQHRNGHPYKITIADNIESETTFDWKNIYNEFVVTYPVDAQDAPTPWTPLHRTLRKKFTAYNIFALESGNFRLLIYYNTAIYEIDRVNYQDTTGSWQGGEQRGVSQPERAVTKLYMDLFRYEKEVKSETYKSVVGYLNGTGTPSTGYLLLGFYIESNNRFGSLKKYGIRRLQCNYMKNETKLKRVEE